MTHQQLELDKMKYLFEKIEVDEFIDQQIIVLSKLMTDKKIEFTPMLDKLVESEPSSL